MAVNLLTSVILMKIGKPKESLGFIDIADKMVNVLKDKGITEENLESSRVSNTLL